MGSSESKLSSVASETKPELRFKPTRVNQLMDPRSPSADIDRTPIQVSDKDSAEVKTVCQAAPIDPRSPSVDISRTPVREVMRATVGTFARRLGMLFLSDAENKAQQKSLDKETDDDSRVEEMASTEPLLPPQASDALTSLDAHATMLDTPLQPDRDAPSPFVFLEDPQLEVELETEPDLSYEEAEEARESPLHKRLSLSLVACHEGQSSSQVYGDVTNSSFQSTEADGDGDSKMLIKEDHTYATPSITIQSPVEPVVKEETVAQSEEKEVVVTSSSDKAEVVEVVNAPTVPPPATLSNKPEKDVPGPRPQRIRCPTIDAKSPSQVVFKPQWLGKGFGGAGLRVNAGKGGSSPLALKVAVKKVSNENRDQAAKAKSKDHEGRSPLQILRETNSPRGQSAQMKMKVSTPEKRRSAPSERRVLAIAVDKENR